MTSILKSDIFFIISSLSTVVVSVAIAITLYYLIKILRDIKFLSAKAREEGERILEDVKAFREEAEDGGHRITNVLYSFLGLMRTKPKSRKRRTTAESEQWSDDQGE
jgi:hypothetical protein